MSDKLTDRLRGQYKIGPDGVYGTRDFLPFIPPICVEAAERIEELEKEVMYLDRKIDSALCCNPAIQNTLLEEAKNRTHLNPQDQNNEEY